MPLIAPATLTLAPRHTHLRTAPVPVDPQVASLVVRLHRPVQRAIIRVTLGLRVDGQEFRATGQLTGGVPRPRDYALRYGLPVLCRDNRISRIGEFARWQLEAWLELELLQGRADLDLLLADWRTALTPAWPIHHSVAFDAATDALESSGDGTITLSHTNVGTIDLAAFAGHSNTKEGGWSLSTSVTYGAVGMTEKWDLLAETTRGNAGYSLANPATGAQTVTGVLAAVPLSQFLGVITLTGVDQATPVGTAVTGSGATSPATVTVSDAGADDLICDNLNAATAPTIGADQTLRNTEDNAGLAFRARQSTQAGTADDVMSWTFTNDSWLLGAIAFKSAGAAATDVGSLMGGQHFSLLRQW